MHTLWQLTTVHSEFRRKKNKTETSLTSTPTCQSKTNMQTLLFLHVIKGLTNHQTNQPMKRQPTGAIVHCSNQVGLRQRAPHTLAQLPCSLPYTRSSAYNPLMEVMQINSKHLKWPPDSASKALPKRAYNLHSILWSMFQTLKKTCAKRGKPPPPPPPISLANKYKIQKEVQNSQLVAYSLLKIVLHQSSE